MRSRVVSNNTAVAMCAPLCPLLGQVTVSSVRQLVSCGSASNPPPPWLAADDVQPHQCSQPAQRPNAELVAAADIQVNQPVAKWRQVLGTCNEVHVPTVTALGGITVECHGRRVG